MKEGWEVKKFSDVFDLQMGKTPSRDNVEYWGDENCWVAISDIKEKYISDTKEYITNKAVLESKIKKVIAGTVIMSFKLTVGRTAITKVDLYTNEAIMAFNLKSNYDVLPEYTYYYLKAYKWEGGNKAVMGITLNKASISANKFVIPPLPEQSRIVEELDLLSNIIEKKRQQLSELDNLAQSIFYDMFGDPVTNEKGFPECTVGDIYKFQYGKGNKIPESKGDYPCYGSNGIVGFHTTYNSEDAPIIGHIGAYAGIVNWGIGKHFVTYNGVICRLKDDKFNPVYGYYVLKNQNYMEKVRGGAAQPFVSYDLLEAPKTIIPPLSLQQLFAQKIEAIEKEKELIKQSIKETEELFNSRMDYYFS